MDINNVVLAGRLTKDVELRYTPNGTATATFTIATNRAFTNQQGEREADFVNCVVWRKPAETIANFFKKGSEIGVIGRIQSRSFEGQDGKRVYVTEVVVENFSFGQKAPERTGNTNTPGNQFKGNTGQSGTFGGQSQIKDDPFANSNIGTPIDIDDSDLPF